MRTPQPNLAEIQAMSFPVRCRLCGGIYDLGRVTVTARYVDCSVWTTPCCGTPGVDDRKSPWGITRYDDLDKRTGDVKTTPVRSWR